MRGVRTPEGDIACDRVVLATGAWARELLRPLGVDVPIALKRIQVAVLRQPAGAPRPNVVCSDAVTNVVVRPDRGALFCAVTYFGDEPLDAADDCDHDASPGYEEAIRRALAERYPALAGAAWQRAWAGPYDYSPDWNPIIGEAPGVAGLHLALAWSGHGFKLSPAVGEVVAAEVLGAEPRIDVTALRPSRFAEGPLLRLAYGPARAPDAVASQKQRFAACSAASLARWWQVGGWSPRRAKGSTASAPSAARAGSGSGGGGGVFWLVVAALLLAGAAVACGRGGGAPRRRCGRRARRGTCRCGRCRRRPTRSRDLRAALPLTDGVAARRPGAAHGRAHLRRRAVGPHAGDPARARPSPRARDVLRRRARHARHGAGAAAYRGDAATSSPTTPTATPTCWRCTCPSACGSCAGRARSSSARPACNRASSGRPTAPPARP